MEETQDNQLSPILKVEDLKENVSDLEELPDWVNNDSIDNKQHIGLINLLKDLKNINKPEIEDIIINALDGLYSDFDSPDDNGSLPPLHQLMSDLISVNAMDLIHNIAEGRYDHESIIKRRDTYRDRIIAQMKSAESMLQSNQEDIKRDNT
jgi:hypothetical protein